MSKLVKIGGRVGFSVALAALLLVGALGQAMPVAAALPPGPTTLTYDIYATDGFIYMADGTPVYIYGYVGGLEGDVLNFLSYGTTSINPGTPDEVWISDGLAPTLVTTTVQAPVAGALNAYELTLIGHAQYPGPLITCRVGDTVIINFKNLGVANPGAPNDPHTIHLHGLDVDAANDGVPETSLAAVPGNDPLIPGYGNLVVYEFSPLVQGTYMYHCHQEADIHVQMGMTGALIVYNQRDAQATNGATSAAGGVLYNWRYHNDFVMLLTEFDVRQHLSEQFANDSVAIADIPAVVGFGGPGSDVDGLFASSVGFNPIRFEAQYWFVNGLSFPDTIHAGGAGASFADWLTAHPGYDPFIRGSASAGEKVLVRVINLGFETQPMHVHGFHPKIIGADERAYTWSNPPGMPTGRGQEIQTITIGSGNVFDLLFDFSVQLVNGTYNAGVYSRYDAANNTPQLNGAVAFPEIPGQSAVIDPVTMLPTINPFYIGGPVVNNLFPFHNHDDFKSTNNGVYPGGQFTMVNVLP